MNGSPELLGAARGSVSSPPGLGLRPTKQWGQNFVVDANTVRRIVRLAGVGPDDVGRRGRSRSRLADPRAAARGRPRHGRRGRPDPGRRPPGHRRGAAADAYRPAHRRTGRRPAPDRAARPAADRPRGQPPLQRLRARRADLPPAPADASAGAGHGPAGGGRAARRRPGLAHLRGAQPQGRLVCGRAARGHGAAGACSGRCRTSTPDSSRWSAGRRRSRPRPARRCSAASTPPSRNVARPCAPRSPDGPGGPAAEAVLRAAGVDPSARGEQLDIARVRGDRRREAAPRRGTDAAIG